MSVVIIFCYNYILKADTVRKVIGPFDTEKIAGDHIDKIRKDLNIEFASEWSFKISELSPVDEVNQMSEKASPKE